MDKEERYGYIQRKTKAFGKHFTNLKEFLMKKVPAEFDVIATDGGDKFKFISIANYQLKRN